MALVVVQVPSIGAAYLSVSLLAETTETTVYDMIPQGYGATLLVKSTKEKVDQILQPAKVEYSIDGILKTDDEKVLRALYSIDNSALKEVLVVIESISPGALIQLGQIAVESGLEIVDLKIPRGAQVTGSVLVTGSSVAIASFQESAELKKAKVQVTLIKVTSALEKFFDISPQ